MNLRSGYKLKGDHAPFSPSSPAWVNYDEQKIIDAYRSQQAKELGTRLHKLACDFININNDLMKLGLPPKRMEDDGTTFNSYCNDAVANLLKPEVIVYYSDYFWGTCDAIRFEDDILDIRDLKTGKTKASFVQLRVYAALYCLEKGIKPSDIRIELRIYQNDEIRMDIPEAEDISDLMAKIILFDNILERYNMG